nr:DBH-like monooxygenase protein 1 homolog [Ciona intestinalis]|eukprot:XP_002129219.1 DBH-like monooxygenase protein 1 homolog [Ciona intestinalis]
MNSFIIIFLGLNLINLCLSDVSPTDNYEHFTVLDQAAKFKVYWKFNQTDITFEIHGNTVGWIGMGISPNGAMTGADMVVGWVKNGIAVVTDRYGVGNTFPPKDPEQNIELLYGTECDGWTVIKFRRQILACESNDRPITADTIRLIYAYGTTDPTGDDIVAANYHGASRGAKSILLLETTGTLNFQYPAGEIRSTFEFLNNRTEIPTRDTYYSCKLMKFPTFSSKQHMVEIAPVVEAGNEQNVHHILLYQCIGDITDLGAVGTSAECNTANMPPDFSKCQSVIHAWAIGGGTFYYPQHVGFPLGEADSPKYVVMETHYDNPTLAQGIIDSSGLRIYHTSQVRQYDAGVLDVGHLVSPVTQLIPPNADSYLQYGECTSDCLTEVMQRAGTSEIKLFSVMLHTHLLGKKIELKHIRNGTELPYLSRENNYDFNYQEARQLSTEVIIKPEDTLQLVCDYKSSGVRSNFTFGGFGTKEEMCLAFLSYYPKIQASSCLTFPEFHSLMTYFGIETYRSQGTGGTLNDYIITTAELNGTSVQTYLNSLPWDQARAENMSETLRVIQRNQICLYNGSYPSGVQFSLPAVEIKQRYIEPIQNCTTPVTGMATSAPASTCVVATTPSINNPDLTTSGASHIFFNSFLITLMLIVTLY